MNHSAKHIIKNPAVWIDDENRFQLDEEFCCKYDGKQPKWDSLLSYITYLRTYSRPIYTNSDETGDFVRNEEFCDTLIRVTEGTFTWLKQIVKNNGQYWDDVEAQQKAQEFFVRMWEFKWLPPGRGLWMMGTKYVEKFGGAALNNCGMTSTEFISEDFSYPFITLMDYSMLGVGMGFDVRGAGKVLIQKPKFSDERVVIEDSREGWTNSIRIVLDAFVGMGELPVDFDYDLIRKEGSLIRGFGGTASGPGPLKELIAYIVSILTSLENQYITSTVIVDIMNCIGRCVVAGNVRRSSEIALGFHNDKEFIALKDPSEMMRLLNKKEEIEIALLPRNYVATRRVMLDELSNFSVLDQEYINIQDHIKSYDEREKSKIKNDYVWKRINNEYMNCPLIHHRWASNNTVFCDDSDDKFDRDLSNLGSANFEELAKQTAENGDPGYAWLKVIRAYGRLCDPPNWKDYRVKGFNPCGEQSLEDNELCCLVETFPNKHDSLEDYKQTLKFAYLYAKVVTCIATHNTKTNAVMSRNRRIGTSEAGVSNMYLNKKMGECIRWWNYCYEYLKVLDEDYSGWMGIPVSNKRTSIKPGGTIPLLAGEEGGMKFTISEFYMRTIRIDHMSPLIPVLQEAGYRVEPDLSTPRSMVVYFPIHKVAKRYAKDISIWEQMALLVNLQAYWSDNMVSATITFQPHESQDIARVLDVYKGKIKCVSFLPYSDHKYLQAPYIPCTKDEYEYAMSQIKEIDFSKMNVSKIHEAQAEDKFCSTDRCLI